MSFVIFLVFFFVYPFFLTGIVHQISKQGVCAVWRNTECSLFYVIKLYVMPLVAKLSAYLNNTQNSHWHVP